jgi:hypothetical protein
MAAQYSIGCSDTQGGWLQVYELPERAGKGSVTLAVSNLEQQIGELKHSGIRRWRTHAQCQGERHEDQGSRWQ